MRHVPQAEFQDRVPEYPAAVEAGKGITVTLDGRAVMLVASSERLSRRRDALDALCERLRSRGVRASAEEMIEWKNEGRR